MATFEAQVEGLTSLSIDGSSAPTQTELTQFLTDGAKEILNVFPLAKKALYTTATSLNASSANLTIGGSEIFSVTRDDGTINQPCRLIPANMSGRASDSDDMNAASATDPVYYITNNVLSVIPEPTNSNNAQVQTLAYPSVAYGDSSITKFPDEAEYLISLYASVRSLQNKLSSKSLETPSLNITAVPPTVPTLSTVSYSTASNADASATAVGAITVATVSKADISGDAPTYSKPSLTTRVSFNTFFEDTSNKNPFADSDPSEFSISVNIPVAPAISTVSYTDASNADASASAIDTTIMSASPISYGSSGDADAILDVSSNAPTFTKPSIALDFAKVNSHIDDNEDIELAQVKLSQLQAQIAEYSANISNEQNEFNKENVRYQMEFQEATEKANRDLQVAIRNLDSVTQELKQESQQTTDIDKFNKAQDQALELANKAKGMEKLIADNNNQLQKYSNELQSYQAEVNKEIQEYTKKLDRYKTEINLAFQAWSKTESDSLQQYQLDIQNELNEYNKENVRYQANIQAELAKHNSDLQKAINQARLDADDAKQEAAQTTDVDKFNKAQDQALDLQNKAKTMEAIITNNDDLVSKFSTELNRYTSIVNEEVQQYQANLQNKQMEYTWYEKQQIKLQADYDKGLQLLIGQGG
tara:strand:- start:1269 stop:3212 length:1944 start_codon:yes stop_codon:yes gene_type:complete